MKQAAIILACIYAFFTLTGQSPSSLVDLAGGRGRGSSSFGSSSDYGEQRHYSTFGPAKRMADYEPYSRDNSDRPTSWGD